MTGARSRSARAPDGPPPTATWSVGFVSLGCAKNLVDSQVMAGALLADGLTLAPSPERADVILVNTCAFIADARTEATQAILRACAHKARGGCRAVVVAGCLPQRYRRRVRATFPQVDAFIGLDQLDQVGTIVRAALTGNGPVLAVGAAAERLYNPARPALRFTGGPFAYLKVAEGCNHGCTFCAIPGIRGRYRSRPLEALLDEARALLATGVRELVLISQDTTSYGRDQRGGPRLPQLIQALDGLEGDFWLRLLYGYPSRVNAALLETLAAARHAVRYLDLPIQHSHPEILRAMQRADTVAVLPDMPTRLRQALPGVTLRTTCLVGFPGETEAHFEHLLEYVTAARFDHLGVFTYSAEEGTPAADLSAPPAAVAIERRDRLLERQGQIVRAVRAGLVERKARALLLRPAGRAAGVWFARMERQAPDVDGRTRVCGVSSGARAGDFVDVRYTGGRWCDLTAEVVHASQPVATVLAAPRRARQSGRTRRTHATL